MAADGSLAGMSLRRGKANSFQRFARRRSSIALLMTTPLLVIIIGLVAYPAGYAIYVFIRGELVGAYPYPFIDVASIGYGAALRNAAGIAVVFVALASILVGLNRVIGPATVPPEN